MRIGKIVYWQDQGMWLGYLEDYMTQGETLEALKDNVKDIYQDIVQI